MNSRSLTRADVLAHPWTALYGPPPPDSPAGRALAGVRSDQKPSDDALTLYDDDDERAYRETLADQDFVDAQCGELHDGSSRVIAGDVPRRRNGQRARVFLDLDSELAERDAHREARLVLAMHRQRLIPTHHAQRRLRDLGFDMGVEEATMAPPPRISPLLVGSAPRRPDLFSRLAWAVAWRLTGLATIVLALASALPVRGYALTAMAVLGPLGLLLRIAHRFHVAGSLWRLSMLATATVALGGVGRWPFVLMAVMGWCVLEGVAAAVRPLEVQA